MSKIRVLRGSIEQFSAAGPTQLIQNDLRFTHGFRIRKFVISFSQMWSQTASGRDTFGVLTTDPDAMRSKTFPTSAVEWMWSDKRQVAWASTDVQADSSLGLVFGLVDPTHIIVRDLWIGITAANAILGDTFNYYIELEEVELSENQAVLSIIQEEAQSAGSHE